MVAHHVSAIVVQAQAGRATAGQRPESGLEALAVIEAEASRTLTDMRAMVRVLREGAPAEYAPQPGVADLVSLARRHPAPVVDVEVPDGLGALPLQVDAAVYRLALVARGRTNAEIAAELFIGLTTAKTHVASLLTKIGARNPGRDRHVGLRHRPAAGLKWLVERLGGVVPPDRKPR